MEISELKTIIRNFEAENIDDLSQLITTIRDLCLFSDFKENVDTTSIAVHHYLIGLSNLEAAHHNLELSSVYLAKELNNQI